MFVYLKNSLYRQKVHKKLHIRHYYGYPNLSSDFLVILLLEDGEKSKNGFDSSIV